MNRFFMFFRVVFLYIFLFLLLSCRGDGDGKDVIRTRCEYMERALGIDVPNPRFTWSFNLKEEGFSQSSYRIRVASCADFLKNGQADVWDSGEVFSSRSFAVYGGVPLASHRVYFWNVSTQDERGNVYVSSISSFETAKMDEKEWSAQWITDGHDMEFEPAPLFRKDFRIDGDIRRARAYVSCTGYYELFINGKRVGENFLDPGYTDFGKRVLYVTQDITSLLTGGNNVAAAVLGNGWANVQSKAVWNFDEASWRSRPRLLCELRIEYVDGRCVVVGSDGSWKTNTGAYIYNNIYSGDRYDGRLEETGWKLSGFDDSGWKGAVPCQVEASILNAQLMPGIRIVREVVPVSMAAFGNDCFVFDMGENITGGCRIKVKGDAGTRISLRHGELLKDNGRLEQGNIDIYYKPVKQGEVFQEDVFILKGTGEEEVFMPSFSYHGFEYVEVTSDRPIELSKESLTGLFMHTDLERTGSFNCSNRVLNNIYKAVMQSYCCNIHSIPTDCPQREKNGWTADAHVAIDLALLNFDGISFYEKWIDDIVDNQRPDGSICGIIPSWGWGGDGNWPGPVWDAVMFVIPDALYNYYGDMRGIEKIYSSCQRYLEFLKGKEHNGLLNYGLGDWLPYNAVTPNDYTSSAYYYYDNVTMARFARLLGKDPSPYDTKAKELKELINRHFFNAETGVYANGTQTAQALALFMGFVPSDKEGIVAKRLHESVMGNGYFLDFGLLGSKTVLAMLTKYGYVDDAMKMVTKTEAPSWGYFTEKMGQSTLGETWIMSPKFNDASLNHVFFGDVAAWMTNCLAGINFDRSNPGFAHIIIRPYFVGDLDWVKGELNTVYGLVRSEWRREEKGIVLTVIVPPNTTASIYADKLYTVKSGTHRFVFNPVSGDEVFN